jgi:hypothetical protein
MAWATPSSSFPETIRQAISFVDSEAIYDLAECAERFREQKKAEKAKAEDSAVE